VAAAPPPIVDRHGLIDESLDAFRDAIAGDLTAYRGHVYRVFNFTRALASPTADRDDKIALAAVFHDLGIWSDHTVDYLPPSGVCVSGRKRWGRALGRPSLRAWSSSTTS
jgi:hypothetical protein